MQSTQGTKRLLQGNCPVTPRLRKNSSRQGSCTKPASLPVQDPDGSLKSSRDSCSLDTHRCSIHSRLQRISVMSERPQEGLDRRNFMIASIATVGASAALAVSTSGANAQDAASADPSSGTVYTG